MNLLPKVTLLIAVSLAVGCANLEQDSDWTAEELHVEARKHLNAKDWERAIEYYYRLEQRYPYGKHAEQSQLELIYAYYSDNKFELAISTANDFIRIYPTHSRVDYAHYLRALAMFDASTSLIDRLTRANPVKRDTSPAKESFKAFQELVTQFPKSTYVAAAQRRMSEILDVIAEHEINVSHYYLRKGAHVAALARAKYVIENYPEASTIEDALEIMLSVYKKMNFKNLYDDTMRVLEQNFPNRGYLLLNTK